MQLNPFFISVTQRVYRVIPDDPANDPLDPSFAAGSSDNRWNLLGEPTLYLAGDPRAMAVEWARHIRIDHGVPTLAHRAKLRRIFAVEITIDSVLDLRDPRVCALLDLRDAPLCFLRSKALCQTTASRLRHDTDAHALLLPSMALLDQLDRWVMALFVDKLPTFPEPFITSVQPQGTLPAAL
jgi:hypothetical protein